ncbi:MAG: PilZ domain-containing protein [Endomicrobiales bacterium]|nr:PilZ domain-containing protein [Endomicrobiales bacterium]
MAARQWRRKYERISCYIPILLRFLGGNPPDGWGVILDISLGGLKIETRTPLKDGQIVFVSFSISEEFNFINVKGVTRRIIQNGIYYNSGIRFVDSIDKQHLQNALQLHLLSTDVEAEA